MFNFDIALHTLIVLIVLLGLLFLFLLGYTFWTRLKKQYWNRYEQKFRDYFFSLLLDYAEQDEPTLSANDIINKISKRSKDYAFFISLLNELDDILDGTERERLGNLIQHPLFANFYKNKLFEFSTNSKIYACMYFQNSGNIDKRVLAKLETISKSNNLKLSFAATKALQSADDWTIRKNALLRFLKRSDISELMVAELLHIFDSGLAEDRPQVTEALKQILLKEIDPSAKNIIVRYMGYQQFYESGDFLYQYLKRIHYSAEKAPLIRGLIIAMGELYHTESASLIKTYCGKGKNIPIRLAAVKTLSTFGGEENFTFLLDHLLEAEFPIRKAVIYELIMNGGECIVLLIRFVQKTNQSLADIKNQAKATEQLNSYLDKILDITSGIKIALNHHQYNNYA